MTDLSENNSGICWRSLDLLARLLEEGDEPWEALLDRPEDALHASAAPGRAETVDKLLRQGLERLQNGAYRQAIDHFTAALKIDPSSAVLYGQRGEAYRLQCEYE